MAEDTIVWDAATDPSATYELWYSADGTLELLDDGGIDRRRRRSRLASVRRIRAMSTAVPPSRRACRRSPSAPAIWPSSRDPPGSGGGRRLATATATRLDATGLQIPGVLDDLYRYDGDLGVDVGRRHPDDPGVGTDGNSREPAPLRRFRPGDAPTPIEMDLGRCHRVVERDRRAELDWPVLRV